MENSAENSVLLFAEAEALISNLKAPKLKDIGSQEWQRHHEYIEKMNLQALLSASSQNTEYIGELLASQGKLSVLIEDLLLTEVWRKEVFSVIMKTNFCPKSTIPLYMALYHEATLVNLLETLLYHEDIVESTDDVCIDLLDYCYRRLVQFTGVKTEVKDNEKSCKELLKQSHSIQFEIAVKAVSIIRYITDVIERLPLSVASRIFKTLNVPCLLVELIQNPPWSKTSEGVIKKFIDGDWKIVEGVDNLKLTKVEAQPWLALFNLLMSPSLSAKYDFNNFNRSQILKLRSYLNEVLLDQLPILIDFRRYLEQLALTQPMSPKNDFILEQLPEIREKILKENHGKFEAIAKHQMKKYFDPNQQEIQYQAQRLAETYDFDKMDSLICGPSYCSRCNTEATKRCSRCKQEWYCTRECQVEHWKEHKPVCDIYVNASK